VLQFNMICNLMPVVCFTLVLVVMSTYLTGDAGEYCTQPPPPHNEHLSSCSYQLINWKSYNYGHWKGQLLCCIANYSINCDKLQCLW
jgi:hypothetical protein